MFSILNKLFIFFNRPQNEIEPIQEVEIGGRPQTLLCLTADPITIEDCTSQVQDPDEQIVDVNKLDDLLQTLEIIKEEIDQEKNDEETSISKFYPQVLRQKSEIVERNANTMMIQENIDEECEIQETPNSKFYSDFLRQKSEIIERSTDTIMIHHDGCQH